MIILNEKEYIEKEYINKNKIDIKKPSNVINLLARYYIHEENLSDEDTYNKINDFLKKQYFGYREDDWFQSIDKYIKSAKNYPLKKVDSVPITKNEMEIIKSCGSKAEQRLLFTIFCIAKFNYIVNKSTNGWVNTPDSELFRMARLTSDLITKEGYIGNFLDKGLLEKSKNNNKTSVRVTFIDADEKSKIELKVFDFRELAYEYKMYVGDGKYIKCEECGILIKYSSNGKTRYCKKCAKEINREQSKNRMFKSRF